MTTRTPFSSSTPRTAVLTLAAALVAAAASPSATAQAQAQLVAAQSEIAFTSRQMGVPVDGRFRRFDAQVAFDPKKPETAKIALGIDLASASLGAAETEAELAKPDWFNTKAFPRATFQSSTVKPDGAGKLTVAGRLSIKGISQDVVVPVTLVGMSTLVTIGWLMNMALPRLVALSVILPYFDAFFLWRDFLQLMPH